MEEHVLHCDIKAIVLISDHACVIVSANMPFKIARHTRVGTDTMKSKSKFCGFVSISSEANLYASVLVKTEENISLSISIVNMSSHLKVLGYQHQCLKGNLCSEELLSETPISKAVGSVCSREHFGKINVMQAC